MNKKTMVLGASANPERYSFKAVTRLAENGHDVVPVGVKPGKIAGLDIILERPIIDDIHTITMYLSGKNQIPYYEYIFSLKPKRIIFNPGAENQELKKLAEDNGIETVEQCTLVMLSLGLF